mmetsp:Transcript_39973/g.65498  ORF Transcript_39973/g.65498 Transcript_39973/m.65498 type:complete len:83 (-) Transcript_39973:8-256(-)
MEEYYYSSTTINLQEYSNTSYQVCFVWQFGQQTDRRTLSCSHLPPLARREQQQVPGEAQRPVLTGLQPEPTAPCLVHPQYPA